MTTSYPAGSGSLYERIEAEVAAQVAARGRFITPEEIRAVRLKLRSQFRTVVPNVYAAGDVIGNPSLASTSMEQARLAMVHAFDLKYREQLAPTLPFGIYTIPECSMVGETEQSLSEKKTPYLVGKAQYVQMHGGRSSATKRVSSNSSFTPTL